jgi:hypothetical protein
MTQHEQALFAMSPTETTVQDLARAIATATIDIDEHGCRIGIALYDLLAQGDPVTPSEIAAHAHEPEAVVGSTLKGWPGVFWDDQGRLVGFRGLAIPDMDHRFHAENGKPWCSNANFFETREAALSWSAQRKMEGEVIELDEARRRGLANWGPLLSANRGIESREDDGDNG